MIEERIREFCKEAVKALYDQEIPSETIGFERTRKEVEGDFTVVVFPLVRYSRKSTEVTAS